MLWQADFGWFSPVAEGFKYASIKEQANTIPLATEMVSQLVMIMS